MPRILVVEDDKYLNKLICDQLLLAEFEVESCLDGESAWKTLQDQPAERSFDAILVDMLLPKMMGAELLTKINESDQFGNLKKYAMSGIYKDPQEVDQISRLHGINSYWTKPFDLHALVSTISGRGDEDPANRWIKSGLLTQTPIEKVFFDAYGAGFTGKLIISTSDRERRVFFYNGHPVGAESSAIPESFGESLVELGYVTAEQRLEASKKMVERKSFLGETLVDLGYIEKDQLFKALRNHNQTLLLKCFFTRQGDYRFEALQELPSHIPLLEFNPFLIMLQAQKKLLSFEALSSLFQIRWESFASIQDRMGQVLPLLNLPAELMTAFSTLSGNHPLAHWYTAIDKSLGESALRALYLMESIGLLSWQNSAHRNVDLSAVPRMDFTTEFKSSPATIDDDAIMSEYMDILNKNFYQLLDIAEDADEKAIEEAYRKARFSRHPDRFGEALSGQSKRILDDILSRYDHAYQTLSNAESRRNYDSRNAKKASDSAADSKRYLAAQDLFRQAVKLLEAEKYARAKELFESAYSTWKPGVEYKLFALFAEFKEVFKPESQAKAVSVLQRMREITYAHSHTERGFILLGHGHRILGQLDAARDAYRRALEVNPAGEEAANALATLAADDHKAKRIRKSLKSAKPLLLKAAALLLTLTAAGVLYHYREALFPKDSDVSTLDSKTIEEIFPATEIRYKEHIAKITIKKGFLTDVPRSVLQSKCRQTIDKIGMFGIRQLFLSDEEEGLKVICQYENLQIVKK